MPQHDGVNTYSEMIILRDLMMSALLHADIIGVIGLWRPNKPLPQMD